MISSSRLAELQHVPPAWQSQERFDRENAQRAEVEVLRGSLHGVARDEVVFGLPWLHKTSIGLIKRPIAQLALIIDRMAIGFVGLSLKPETPNPEGYCRLPSCICNSRTLSSCLAAPMGTTSCGKHVARVVVPEGRSSKTDSETGGKDRELKRKLSERALAQRKARAREEPSPGPPASETDAGPPGHQPRGGAPARPRLSHGQEGPT